VAGEVLTMRAAALRFVLSNHLVSSAVLGPRNVAQLEQLVREAGEGAPYLSDAALARLPGDLARLGVTT
jgi:aryl-alcohol dehydrogenase-like predicted oxidoreductase